MLSIAYYFLQVTLCSAVMMLYYGFVLRNKRFHQYNRFYLLGVAVLAWLMPLLKIEINKPQEAVSIPIQLFSVIADTNSEFEKTVADKGFQLSWEMLAVAIYLTVSSVLLIMLIVALVKIYKLLKTNSCKNLDNVYLVLTQANGTPFSFFKFIFWHTDIDVTTSTGKQMLRHELTHVQEKHSADKLLLQIVLVFGWLNPIFWLLKRELETIHEFIADHKTIDNGDTATLATMLLAAAYPQQRFTLTNPFFYSPIKRRIAMLTNNKHPRFSYARRLVVLPLLVTVTLLFAFRKKETKPITLSVASALENVVGNIADVTNTADCLPVNVTNAKLTKTYTVVIDAGHGGTDPGAPGIDGKSFEKDIALSISRLVKAQNANTNINIVLTRDNDVFLTPPQRVDFVNKLGADLFVSLHCNSKSSAIDLNGRAKGNPMEGVEVIIANKQKAKNYQANYELANYLQNSLLPLNSGDKGILTRQVGIWILQETNCPSSLIECGYMDVANDLKKLKNTQHQQTLATNILKGIETYLVSKEKGVISVAVDTVPKKKVVIIDSNKVVTLTSKSTALNGKLLNDTISINVKKSSLDSVLIIVAGKKIASTEMNKLIPADIKSITVLKDKTATEKYGEEGKNGVIEIELKEPLESLKLSKVFTEVQTPAEFPGGAMAWKKYLDRNLKIPEEAKTKNAPAGKYSVEVAFIVGVDGGLSNIKALTDPGYGTADAAIALIAKGPKWQPAVQNGIKVTSIKKLSIAFVIDEKSVFNSKNSLEQFIATQRVLPSELNKFQQVSADISEVFWVGSFKHLFINIIRKSGAREIYDLFDVKNKAVALAKYDESLLFHCKFLLDRIDYLRKSLKA